MIRIVSHSEAWGQELEYNQWRGWLKYRARRREKGKAGKGRTVFKLARKCKANEKSQPVLEALHKQEGSPMPDPGAFSKREQSTS